MAKNLKFGDLNRSVFNMSKPLYFVVSICALCFVLCS